jgi:hypothetical protein
MNCGHHNLFFFPDNELICTACSPNRAGGKPVNNSNQPVKSSDSDFTNANYSQLFQARNGCGEQVLFAKFWKFFIAARRQTAAFFKKTKAALCREAATPKKLPRAIFQRRRWMCAPSSRCRKNSLASALRLARTLAPPNKKGRPCGRPWLKHKNYFFAAAIFVFTTAFLRLM